MNAWMNFGGVRCVGVVGRSGDGGHHSSLCCGGGHCYMAMKLK